MAVNDESAAESQQAPTRRGASSPPKGQPSPSGAPSAVSGARRETTIAGQPTELTRQHGATDIPEALARRVIIERIQPEIDAGRFPIKRTPGETVAVSATIFADGHDVIAAVLCDRSGSGLAEAVPYGGAGSNRDMADRHTRSGSDKTASPRDGVSRAGWREAAMTLDARARIAGPRSLRSAASAGTSTESSRGPIGF